jgi:hypothetical protein
MVVVDFKDNRISIKGKKLFATVGKEEVVEVRLFDASSFNAYNQIHTYLYQKLASAYYTAEILTWLEDKIFSK